MKKYYILIFVIFVVLLLMGSPVRQIYAPFKYRSLVKEYSSKYGLDWLLVTAIIYHESRFRTNAVSPKGACGLMQVMPDTAQEVAKKLEWKEISPDELFDPQKNLEIGCWYFSSLLKEFHGDSKMALVAYNAGKGSVYRWSKLKKGNLSYPSNEEPAYSNIDERLYPETKKYIQRVDGTYSLLKTLDKVWSL